MNALYDFHIHSCLSPCGDNDMTPNNIVNMAQLLGYNIIALTDHNSALNCPAAVTVGEKIGLTVVPGMELCTAEEIHVVCLFSTLEDCMAFNDYVYAHSMHIKNRPDIYGDQLVLDENDKVIAKEENLLITGTNITITQVQNIVENKYNGVCYPAHIDRDSYSIISSLGEFPLECNFSAVEVTPKGNIAQLKQNHSAIQNTLIMQSSDAHYLENMPEPSAKIDLLHCNARCVIDRIKCGTTNLTK